MHYRVTRGLNIPIKAPATEDRGPFISKTQALDVAHIHQPLKLCVEENTVVQKGAALCFLKKEPSVCFVSPASGTVKQIIRGEKRKLLAIVIEKNDHPPLEAPLNPQASTEQILEFFAQRGLFYHLEKRPFCRVPEKKCPDKIFVSLVTTTPFAPTFEQQVHEQEQAVELGLHLLNRLSSRCYLISPTPVSFQVPQEFKHVLFTGPHPAESASLHIQTLDPIQSEQEIVWVLNAHDLVTIGQTALTGQYHTSRCVAVAGEGFEASVRGFYQTELGVDLSSFKSRGVAVVGSCLSGKLASSSPFLGKKDVTLVGLLQAEHREFLHFCFLGSKKYTATRTYLSRFFHKAFSFTNQMHGEHRALIDNQVYDKVTPFKTDVVGLIKALLTKNFELACQLGLLELAPEDFELPAFICPSKTDMISIVQKGLKEYYDLLHE